MRKKIAVAIDGPAGAGKSTIAKKIAEKLNYVYVDTGAMYRSVALKALRAGADLADEEGISLLAEKMLLKLEPALVQGVYTNKVYLDGEDVTEAIRSPEVNRNVSRVAAIPGVRTALVSQQRRMAALGGTVMDGRDIGTVVLPEAELKIYLTASIEERALRRYREMQEKGYEVSLPGLQREIAERDRADMEREHSPLRQAEDAVLLDTTDYTIEEAVAEIMKLYRERTAG